MAAVLDIALPGDRAWKSSGGQVLALPAEVHAALASIAEVDLEFKPGRVAPYAL